MEKKMKSVSNSNAVRKYTKLNMSTLMFVTMMSGMRGDISLVADFSLDGRTEG
jgi:hypothetical protein